MNLLTAAGNEAVARLLSNAGILLAKHPDQRQKLRDNPSIIPQAIEELLRHKSPSPIQFRLVAKDVEIHGKIIKTGENIVLLTASATRDDRHWENPEECNVERKPKRHVTLATAYTAASAHHSREQSHA